MPDYDKLVHSLCMLFGSNFLLSKKSLRHAFLNGRSLADTKVRKDKWGYGKLSTYLSPPFLLCRRWKHTDSSSSFFRHPTVIKVSDSKTAGALCRGFHQSTLQAGFTDVRGNCVIGFADNIYKLDAYQVMVDARQTSRLEWRKWDIFTKRPIGMVSVLEGAFAARAEDARGRLRFGDLRPRRGLSGNIALLNGDKVEYVTQGEILVEIEPVKYKLEKVEFVTRRAKVNAEDVQLSSRVISHDEVEGQRYEVIRSVIAYNATYHYYWGQQAGLIKALPSTSETFGRSKRIHFAWGLPLVYQRHRILEVAADLQPGTSMKVSAKASRTTTEVPYSATLIALFADGKRTEKAISGTYVETLLTGVQTEYGRPYFTANGTFAPTTTTSSTTSTSSTTTAPAAKGHRGGGHQHHRQHNHHHHQHNKHYARKEPSTTTPNPLRRFYPDIEDENEISTDGKKSSSSSMQSDEASSKASKRSPQPLSTDNSAAGGYLSSKCLLQSAIIAAAAVILGA